MDTDVVAEHDERKLMGTKFIFVMSMVLITAVYYKRWKWAPIKSRRWTSVFLFCSMRTVKSFILASV